VNNPEVVDHIRNLEPEVILVIAFGQKIGSELLNLPSCRAINLHGSLLPKYRGAAPINWALIKGEKQTGLSIIELNEVWDAGNLLGRLATDIEPGERAGELHDRLAHMGPEIVSEVLEKIAAGADTPLPQDDSQASRAPKLKKSDGAIRWDRPAEEICNFIHGMWPWPGAFCYLQQEDTKKERLVPARAAAKELDNGTAADSEIPGTLAEDMSIICGRGKIAIMEVKPENGKLMDFSDFINGRHLRPGGRFLDG
jgi:methionyl-tRNA formyltransferase